MSRSAQEGSSSHAEPVALHLDDAGDDRRRQYALAIAEVSHIKTALAQFVRQGRAGQRIEAHLGITGHADKR